MTLLEVCQRYNKLAAQMLKVAQQGDWETFFDLDQESQQYSNIIVQQGQQGVQLVEDPEVRIFLAEVVSYFKEIAKLVTIHQNELKGELSLDILTSKLEKLYSG